MFSAEPPPPPPPLPAVRSACSTHVDALNPIAHRQDEDGHNGVCIWRTAVSAATAHCYVLQWRDRCTPHFWVSSVPCDGSGGGLWQKKTSFHWVLCSFPHILVHAVKSSLSLARLGKYGFSFESPHLTNWKIHRGFKLLPATVLNANKVYIGFICTFIYL